MMMTLVSLVVDELVMVAKGLAEGLEEQEIKEE